jgi:FKBP-type peptidyl-prolyl cis-trans isomerase 2
MPSESHPAHPSSDVTQSGDLVRIEYDLWAESGGKTELLDTTHEEVAQKENIPAPEGFTWGPRPHQIGGDRFPTGIEGALVGLKVGEEVEREFAPADAFGERDPNLIELFSMHEIERLPEMRREDARLDIGTVLTIEGRRGRVISLTAARVRVDFNPPFAGRKIRGKFKVAERIVDPPAQVRAILELQYGRSAEFGVEHHEKTITLKLPERSKFDISWMAAKPRVVDRLRTHLHPQTIRIVEEYVTPAPEKKEEPEKAKPAAEPPAEKSAAAPSPAASPTDEGKAVSKTSGKGKSPSAAPKSP